MKKLLSIVLSAVLALSVLAACGSTENANTDSDAAVTEETAAVEETAEAAEDTAAASDVKIGVVLVGDENEGYTYAHIAGIKAAADAVGIPQDNIIWKYSIPEDETCYTSCVDLVDQGCVAIFSNSYGHQSFTQQAAAEYPDVQFVAMTGDTAARSGLDNFSNAFTKVYESRFVSGVVAGLKVKELVESGALADNNFDADGNVLSTAPESKSIISTGKPLSTLNLFLNSSKLKAPKSPSFLSLTPTALASISLSPTISI